VRNPWILALLAAGAAFLALWLAWKIGKFLAKLALALVLVSLVGLVLWYLLHR
jgi:hypothetical protein